VEELLDPNIFYRANRQAIIQVDFIQSIRPSKAPACKKWFDR